MCRRRKSSWRHQRFSPPSAFAFFFFFKKQSRWPQPSEELNSAVTISWTCFYTQKKLGKCEVKRPAPQRRLEDRCKQKPTHEPRHPSLLNKPAEFHVHFAELHCISGLTSPTAAKTAQLNDTQQPLLCAGCWSIRNQLEASLLYKYLYLWLTAAAFRRGSCIITLFQAYIKPLQLQTTIKKHTANKRRQDQAFDFHTLKPIQAPG